jgi:hypothetical protein
MTLRRLPVAASRGCPVAGLTRAPRTLRRVLGWRTGCLAGCRVQRCVSSSGRGRCEPQHHEAVHDTSLHHGPPRPRDFAFTAPCTRLLALCPRCYFSESGDFRNSTIFNNFLYTSLHHWPPHASNVISLALRLALVSCSLACLADLRFLNLGEISTTRLFSKFSLTHRCTISPHVLPA